MKPYSKGQMHNTEASLFTRNRPISRATIRLGSMTRSVAVILAVGTLIAFQPVEGSSSNSSNPAPNDELTIFSGAKVWTGVGNGFTENAALVVADGRIVEVFSLDDRELPDGIKTIDVSGKYIVPGLINAHGHIGVAKGLQMGPDARTRENVEDQLKLSARYGVTTVVSLGGEPEAAFEVRDSMDAAAPGMARLFLAGRVPSPSTAEQAREEVAALARQNPDWLKIRVDDGLGTRSKMPREAYSAFIEAARERELPVATHMVILEDARGLLEEGTGLLAHSIRDASVDDELIALMLARNVCLTPTLTREVSTFVYAERPDFFDDPFFLREADPDVIAELERPEVQQRYTGRAADYFREALPLAEQNMVALHEAGVRIAMGTDSGMPARFIGYFEHLEMEMMQDAGMAPVEVLRSATVHAADCINLGEELGTLEPGKRADFLVLEADPTQDIRNLREMVAVHIGGRPLE